MIAGFAGKPTGADQTITVATTTPTRHVEIILGPDGVTFTSTPPVGTPDLEVAAEALIRLVYGRLDPDHTPPVNGAAADLAQLRRAFPGV